MKFNDVQDYLDQFIGLEASKIFEADSLGVLIKYGSVNDVSHSNSLGYHIPVEVEDDDNFRFKVVLSMESFWSKRGILYICRGYRAYKVLNLKLIKAIHKDINNKVIEDEKN